MRDIWKTYDMGAEKCMLSMAFRSKCAAASIWPLPGLQVPANRL